MELGWARTLLKCIAMEFKAGDIREHIAVNRNG